MNYATIQPKYKQAIWVLLPMILLMIAVSWYMPIPLLKTTIFTTTNIPAPAHELRVDGLQTENIWQDGILADVANMEHAGDPVIWAHSLADGFSKMIYWEVILLLGLAVSRTLFTLQVSRTARFDRLCRYFYFFSTFLGF